MDTTTNTTHPTTATTRWRTLQPPIAAATFRRRSMPVTSACTPRLPAFRGGSTSGRVERPRSARGPLRTSEDVSGSAGQRTSAALEAEPDPAHGDHALRGGYLL